MWVHSALHTCAPAACCLHGVYNLGRPPLLHPDHHGHHRPGVGQLEGGQPPPEVREPGGGELAVDQHPVHHHLKGGPPAEPGHEPGWRGCLARWQVAGHPPYPPPPGGQGSERRTLRSHSTPQEGAKYTLLGDIHMMCPTQVGMSHYNYASLDINKVILLCQNF